LHFDREYQLVLSIVPDGGQLCPPLLALLAVFGLFAFVPQTSDDFAQAQAGRPAKAQAALSIVHSSASGPLLYSCFSLSIISATRSARL
jgi:hypothetical protein